MTYVAFAIAGSAILGAGASVYAGKQASGATNDATKRAVNAQLQMYNQTRADLAPYRMVGYGALDQLAQLYGVPMGARRRGTPSNGSPPQKSPTSSLPWMSIGQKAYSLATSVRAAPDITGRRLV